MTYVHKRLLAGFRVLALTVCAMSFGNPSLSSAAELSDRFLELSNDGDVTTYDLSTVQIILPGKFTVIGTTIDNPDVMKLELTALDTLRSYCAKPDGTYSLPDGLFTLGKPDMPVTNITVRSGQTKIGDKSYAFKQVIWKLPYRRVAIGSEERPSFFDCEGPQVKSKDDEYQGLRSLFLNGIRRKTMYDCKHGVMGHFVHEDDDVSKVISGTVRGGFLRDYIALCRKLGTAEPYLPQ
jgi:hypothetical protein